MSHQGNPTPITELMVAGFALALLASTFLWSPSGSSHGIALDQVLPLVASDATHAIAHPGEPGPTGRQGIAGLVLLSVAAVAGAPIVVESSLRRPVLNFSAGAVTFFAVATFLQNGRLFLPSAVFTRGSRFQPGNGPVIARRHDREGTSDAMKGNPSR